MLSYECHSLPPADWCPNNQRCPILLYREVHAGESEELAEWFEACFARNGWPPAWRYTVYNFPHFHSNTHEVLGVFRGRATIQLGDTVGQPFELVAGDVVLIPAGVSHQRLQGTADFQAVGAYPAGYEPDMIRKGGTSRNYAIEVARVPIPPSDPVAGLDGPLLAEWRV